jgi:hypothetical protein
MYVGANAVFPYVRGGQFVIFRHSYFANENVSVYVANDYAPRWKIEVNDISLHREGME